MASPQAQISIRGASVSQLHNVTVTGSRSGHHAGRLVAHPGGPGASFVPEKPFEPGEAVAVSIRVSGPSNPRGSRSINVSTFRFTVAQPASLGAQAGPAGKPTRPDQVQSFKSRPDLRPPTVTLQATSSHTAPGNIFIGPANKLGHAGPMIVDPRLRTIWFHPLPGNTQAFSFQEQRYGGKPVLTWWQGEVSSRGYGNGEDVIYDSSYRQIATVRAAEGYRADMHDFLITSQGSALILAYNPVRMDLSSLGGPRDGTVLDGVVQELDIRSGMVLFEWHSVGNVPLSDSQAKPAHDGVFDYFHINSVALDSDGNLIVSARNTWAIYKINRQTGQIMWRLGGKRSSFKLGPKTEFAYQHDARRQPDGTITLFDNGAEPKVHPQSRAIALRLDMKGMRVTLAREWTHPNSILAGSQGNMQTLPNGNRFVGWGAQPNLTEFSPEGRVVFDASLASPDTSYRAYRFPWSATPTSRPAIATTAEPGGKVAIHASWNGATNIASWRVLAGATQSALKPLTEVPRTGFETADTVSTTAPYVAVQALDGSGHVLATSPAAKPGTV